MTQEERLNDMLNRYGEVCRKSDAARILHRCPTTINQMLKDGRIDYACGGEMVDVRSIARYIATPAAEDSRARRERAMNRNGCRFRV